MDDVLSSCFDKGASASYFFNTNRIDFCHAEEVTFKLAHSKQLSKHSTIISLCEHGWEHTPGLHC